ELARKVLADDVAGVAPRGAQPRAYGRPQSKYDGTASRPSRWRPPAQAANHAATAPKRAAAPVMKPSRTAAWRARSMSALALPATSVTRLSASPGARPVVAATRRTR